MVTGQGKGVRAIVNRSPFRIGRSIQSDFRMDLPGLPDDYCILFEEEDGWVLVPSTTTIARSELLMNGVRVTSRTVLRHGDLIGLPQSVTLRVVTEDEGDQLRAGRVLPPREPARPLVDAAHSRNDALLRAARSARDVMPSGRRLMWSTLGIAAIAAAIGVTVFAIRTVRSGAKQSSAQEEQPLSEADAVLFDTLLTEAYDHLERGASLLDLGAGTRALTEFARAVNTLESSRLRSNPWLRPRIEALEAQVAAMYRSRNMSIPSTYASIRSVGVALRLRSSVSPEQFGGLVEQVGRTFASTFRQPLVVTGRDHAEHLALYGRSGAVDLRVRGLSPEQIHWVVTRFQGAGLRVKDFSTDSVLVDQVARAKAAGLADRAGTGLHVHVDRFPGRADRYTVPAAR